MQYVVIVAMGVSISMAAVVAGIWLAGGAEAVRRNAPGLLWLVPLMVLVGVVVIATYSLAVAAGLAAIGAILLSAMLRRGGWPDDAAGSRARRTVWLAVVLQAALALALAVAFILGRS